MQANPSAEGRDDVAEIVTALAPGLGRAVAQAVGGRGTGPRGRAGTGAGAVDAAAGAGSATRRFATICLVDGAPVAIPHNPVAAVLRRAAFAVACGCAAFAVASLGSLV